MFENIGEKIKALARVLCWMGIIFSFIMGMFTLGEDVFIALCYLVLGPVISWTGSFFLYGFGTLVKNSEKSTAYLKYLADLERKRESDIKDRDAEASKERAKEFASNKRLKKCPNCRNIVDYEKLDENGVCPWCGSMV